MTHHMQRLSFGLSISFVLSALGGLSVFPTLAADSNVAQAAAQPVQQAVSNGRSNPLLTTIELNTVVVA